MDKTEKSVAALARATCARISRKDKIAEYRKEMQKFQPKFVEDKAKLKNKVEQAEQPELLANINSKFYTPEGAPKEASDMAMVNILRSIQNARMTVEFLVCMALILQYGYFTEEDDHIYMGTNTRTGEEADLSDVDYDRTIAAMYEDKLQEELEFLREETGLFEKFDEDVPRDVHKRIKTLSNTTAWRAVFVSKENRKAGLRDVTDVTGTVVTPMDEDREIKVSREDLLCAVPVSPKEYAFVQAYIPMVGPQLTAAQSVSQHTWKTCAPCIVEDKKRKLAPDSVKIIENIWKDPARGGFRGARATWHHVQKTNVLGITEQDVLDFLKNQELTQLNTAPNVKGIYNPIVPQDIGHVQMDLIVVKFEKTGARRATQGSAPAPACIACRRVKDAFINDLGQLEVRKLSYDDNLLEFSGKAGDYTYIITMIDLFSKFVWAYPIRTREAANVVGFLEQLWLTEGPPRILQTDNGTEFIADGVSALSARFNVERRRCRPYNSQCDGVIERLNRTLQESLSKAMYEYFQNNWWDMLQLVVYAYNTTRHSTTRLSPFLVHRGREPQALGNVMLRPAKAETSVVATAVEDARRLQEERAKGLPPPAPPQRTAIPRIRGGEDDVQCPLSGGAFDKKALFEAVDTDRPLCNGTNEDNCIDPGIAPRAASAVKSETRKARFTAVYGNEKGKLAFDISNKPLSDLIPKKITLEAPEEETYSIKLKTGVKECSVPEGCTFQFQNNEIQLQVGAQLPSKDELREGVAHRLAADEARRKLVFSRVQSKAEDMITKSLEKHHSLNQLTNFKTDLDFMAPVAAGNFAPFAAFVPRNITSQGQRVRLSLLYFAKYRRDAKIAFKRPSVTIALWTEYSFRVMAPVSFEKDVVGKTYVQKYWIRLENNQQFMPPEEDMGAFEKVADMFYLKTPVERQQMLPIPDVTNPPRGASVMIATTGQQRYAPPVTDAMVQSRVEVLKASHAGQPVCHT